MSPRSRSGGPSRSASSVRRSVWPRPGWRPRSPSSGRWSASRVNAPGDPVPGRAVRRPAVRPGADRHRRRRHRAARRDRRAETGPPASRPSSSCTASRWTWARSTSSARCSPSAGEHRLVFYDQPGHGRSSRLKSGDYDIAALGRSLAAVLDATVPDGHIILVGHSMGGMTIMAFAEQYPEWFGSRVTGVVLMSTSAGLFDKRQDRPCRSLVARASAPVLPALGQGRPASAAVRSTGPGSFPPTWPGC